MSFISEKEFQDILSGGWDQLCFSAYDGYKKYGRGLVAIAKNGADVKAVFTHPAEGHIIDPYDLDLVNRYDPEKEIIVQYPSAPGRTKTVKLEVADENSPREIWNKFNIEE